MTISTLVDTDIFIDNWGPDTVERQWSLKQCVIDGDLVTKAVIWSKLAASAHADWRRHRLLKRDAARYRSYYPFLDLITPETHRSRTSS
ncbi:hypothetical protein EV130_109230 [Rhizobium azibense]|uniref:PIN domain-containing protein n=1 Tax=Rhizobium azibense TaxID=1136135 RepID=A0A4V6P0Z8_9HYPH|nr:hypothetical protein [Rhizobium azibense]TCU22435.1 hypothetical protein EV130_109230 [Rhizobium azibense]